MSAELAKRHWKWATNALNAANRDAISHDPQNAVSRRIRKLGARAVHAGHYEATTFLTEIRIHLRNAGLQEGELGAVPPLPGIKASRAARTSE